MENFEDFIRLNESKNEMTLLYNLYAFYKKKYTYKKIAKAKFREQVELLKKQGEVSAKVVNKFFEENDIPPIDKPKKPSISDLGCGSTGCGSISSDEDYDDEDEDDDFDPGCGSTNTGCGSVSSNTGCGSAPVRPVRRSSYYSGCGSTNVGC